MVAGLPVVDDVMVGKEGFEPSAFLMCRIYSPVPVRRPSSFPVVGQSGGMQRPCRAQMETGQQARSRLTHL
jgi:hypothetical protein